MVFAISNKGSSISDRWLVTWMDPLAIGICGLEILARFFWESVISDLWSEILSSEICDFWDLWSPRAFDLQGLLISILLISRGFWSPGAFDLFGHQMDGGKKCSFLVEVTMRSWVQILVGTFFYDFFLSNLILQQKTSRKYKKLFFNILISLAQYLQKFHVFCKYLRKYR